MNDKVTMQDIANSLGVTKVSVSKALNSQPGVGEELRKRIIETAERMGYVGTKRFSSGKVSRTYAYIVTKRYFIEADNFYNVIIYYLGKRCAEYSSSLYSYVLSEKDESDCVIPPNIAEQKPDGIFLIGEMSEKYILALKKLDIPLVAVDFSNPMLDIDCVIPDNYGMAMYIASYLYKNGHTRIGFVGDIKASVNILDRYMGYKKALSVFSLHEREDWVISDIGSNSEYNLDFVLPEEMPTAFICHCDTAAYYLIQKLHACGMRVPEDVSVVSFDNTEMAARCVPGISTIDINKREIAYRSVSVMTERLENAPSKPRASVYSDLGTLIERDSVKAISI